MQENINVAIQWAISQFTELPTNHELVDKVREYFNENGIEYNTFSYDDLEPFLPQ